MVVRSVYLPVELIETILSKSPVKSLLRFKSVSKQWQAMISDPRFSRIHRIQRSKLSENQNMFVAWMWPKPGKKQLPDTRICLMIRMEDGKLITVSSELADDHQSSKYPSFTLLCSCNGIFLLTYHHRCYQLWNPLIRKYSTMIIPVFSDRSPLKCHLYHDERSDDYKIVIVYKGNVGEHCNNDHGYIVYSCNNRSWGGMLDFPFDGYNANFVDGCFYYLSSNSEIVFFDVRDGKLDKVPQPNYDHDHDHVEEEEEEEFEIVQYVKLKVISGRLCLCSHTYETSGDEVRRYTRYELWVMEKNENLEHCWRKLINMEMEEEKTWLSQLVCLSNEDNYVVIGRFRNESKLSLYNCGEKVIQKIEFDWSDDVYGFFQYQENLYIPA